MKTNKDLIKTYLEQEKTNGKQNYLNKGYTDVQIETITCSKFIKELNNNPSLF